MVARFIGTIDDNMKVFIVQISDVLTFPPILNLINLLEKNGVETELIATKSEFLHSNKFEHVKFFELDNEYSVFRSKIEKLVDMQKMKKQIWEEIDKTYTKDDVIWITSDTALKHLGKRILKYNYVFQLMELSEELKYYKKLPFKMDASKIGNKALAVVVPEFNRAHIIKAWWKLNEKPMILANKPYITKKFVKNNEIEDKYARDIITKLQDKKIILYQGIIHRERPLDKYIYAVNKLGDDYAFVVMSGGENIYKDIESSNYYFIPYVKAPNHLQITSHAYIGVLSYFPVQTDYSILNALFCAPNKTFEYAMFNVPMIGNDVPGLKYAFDTTGCGVCIENFEVDSICKAIKDIESNYEVMSNNAKKYYAGTDIEKQLMDILEVVQKKIKRG